MAITLNTLNQLKLHEGFRDKPYMDSTGHLTIGYGFNLDAQNVSYFEMTEDQASSLLFSMLEQIETKLLCYLPIFKYLDEVRQAVLLDMAYNLGVDGLFKFKKTLDFLSRGDFENASIEMLNSKWAKQVGDRAKRLSQQMKLGEWCF